MLFYQLTYTLEFQAQLNALPEPSRTLVREKVRVLEFDPRPDGRFKIKLERDDSMYRLKAGNYRVFYLMADQRVEVLGVATRGTVYRKIDRIRKVQPLAIVKAPSIEQLVELDNSDDEPDDQSDEAVAFLATDWYRASDAQERSIPTTLPRRVEAPLLEALRVPVELWELLIACGTVEQLLDAAVPEDVRERIFDAISEPDLDALVTAPKFHLEKVDQLIYDKEFDQIDLLLRLDDEQLKYVNWAIAGSGPALLKGGPGTGKSIVAIHRAVALIDRLRQSGIASPRILYTTYTRALAESSRQLIARLAGSSASAIDVRHFDALHLEILEGRNAKQPCIDDGQRRYFIKTSLERIGKDRDGAKMKEVLSRLSPDYLSDEIDQVIVGRGIRTQEDYLTESRTGRRVRLTADQRLAIWRLHKMRSELLRNKRFRTWEMSRAVALDLVSQSIAAKKYDAVLVDEAQDLDPNAIRTLVALCSSTDRVFITADPNQSIYGSGFQWSAVHHDLQFRGRTSILRRNYRSTREIGLGATAFLKGGELDDDEAAALEYVHSGPLPLVRYVVEGNDTLSAALEFIEDARRRNRIGYGGVAILVPIGDIGRMLERQLRERGTPAEFVRKEQIDLQSPRIKIMTLHTAKGLEFPVVVLAGLEHRIRHSREMQTSDSEERLEREQLNRRLLFVAMTRAMRELAVVMSEGIDDPLVAGIGGAGWDVEHWPAATSTSQ